MKQLFSYFEGLFLLSEYTFGFELEATAINHDAYNEFVTVTDTFFKASKTIRQTKGPAFVDDMSIDRPTPQLYPFEYRSPIFNVTPDNISKVISFLKSNLGKYFVTNSSCAFHIHIGFPKNVIREDIEAFWFLCQLVANEKLKEYEERIDRFMNYKNFKFEGTQQNIFATLNNLKEIEKGLKSIGRGHGTINRLTKAFDSDKYNFFRLHPQGTLEWRGPRDFLKEETPEMVKQFFLEMFFPLIRLINNLIEKDKLVYDDFSISKKNFYELLRKKPSTKLKQSKFLNTMKEEDIKNLYMNFPWLRKCKFYNAEITYDNRLGILSFEDGIWEDGVWEDGMFNGVWENGIWKNGTFVGDWEDGEWLNGKFEGNWSDGIWRNGIFKRKAKWYNGKWYNGTFKGKWFDGEFFNGVFEGKWKDGTWHDGEFYGLYFKGE
jgi:hypothetical protein